MDKHTKALELDKILEMVAEECSSQDGAQLARELEPVHTAAEAQWLLGETDAAFTDEIVCFDIETTGLNRKYEVIIEIGAVVLKNGEITDRFNTFVSPGRILSPEIIRLTGIADEMLEGAPSQEEALRAFLAFTGDRPLAAHNAEFDISFIRAGCAKVGLEFSPTYVDSLILAQNLLPDLGKYKLDIVAEHLHLPAFNHHRAMPPPWAICSSPSGGCSMSGGSTPSRR